MNIVLLVTAGKGTRLQMDTYKAFATLKGEPLFYYPLQLFEEIAEIDEIVLIVHQDDIEKAEDYIKAKGFSKISEVIGGADTRQASVWNGLSYLETKSVPMNSRILIHNGANPLLSEKEVQDVLSTEGTVALGYPAKDTIKQVDKNLNIIKTLDRNTAYCMQTPQVINFDLALNAFVKAKEDGYTGTDDVELVERLGEKVTVIPCSYRNFKITTQEDLILAEKLLE